MKTIKSIIVIIFILAGNAMASGKLIIDANSWESYGDGVINFDSFENNMLILELDSGLVAATIFLNSESDCKFNGVIEILFIYDQRSFRSKEFECMTNLIFTKEIDNQFIELLIESNTVSIVFFDKGKPRGIHLKMNKAAKMLTPFLK